MNCSPKGQILFLIFYLEAIYSYYYFFIILFMFSYYFETYYQTYMENFFETSILFLPKIIAALSVFIIGFVIAYGTYKITMYIFDKFKIVDRINSLYSGFEEHTTNIVETAKNKKITNDKKENLDKIRYDYITAKALSYYIFLLFFRWAIVILGITAVEEFMQDILSYLPNLFVGIMIGFFGLRFANSVYDIMLKASKVTKQNTGHILAMGAKIIVMFFTLMIVLNYIKIVDQFIINALFIGFICTLTIAFGLAFGLGGRNIAQDILESFKK